MSMPSRELCREMFTSPFYFTSGAAQNKSPLMLTRHNQTASFLGERPRISNLGVNTRYESDLLPFCPHFAAVTYVENTFPEIAFFPVY